METSRSRTLGSFQLTEQIGLGGMGEVWRARHGVLGVDVAIKLLTADNAHDGQFRQAFADEVRAAAALAHPHVITIFDYGTTAAGAPWLAMELVGGGTLLDHCARMDWDRVHSTLTSVLSALAHAHARGVLHRDLKPENVLLAGPRDMRPGLKIADFGLATQVWAAGTPGYAPPEQVSGEWHRQGPWTDLFAVGRLAMALVAGDPLAATPAIRVPVDFMGWIVRCCAADPRDRFRRAADAAAALDALGPASTQAPTPMAPIRRVASQLTWTGDLEQETPVAAQGVPDTRAPIPRDWRGTDAAPERLSLEWVGAGLGLLGIRTVPLVARQMERDVLWSALLKMVDTGQPGVVLLKGPEGVGSTRLASWLAQRGHETGAATPIVVRHTVDETTRPDGGFIRVEGGALTVTAVAALARDRPVVLVLDDAHYGADSLRIASRLLATSLPVLVVLTARTEVLAERPEERSALQRILGAPDASALPIGPLDESAGLALVQALIGADPTLATQVHTRAQGNPRFAIQLVRDWVRQSLIRPGPYGYRLDGQPREPEFDDQADWENRIARVLADSTAADGLALELAAVLGSSVDRTEWLKICQAGQSTPSPDLVDRLAQAGIARPHRGGWSFAHELIRHALIARATAGSRAVEHHRRCAEALVANRHTHARIGRHWLAAHVPERAVDALRDASDAFNRSMQYYAALQCMDDWHDAMVQMGVPPEDERWAWGWFHRAHLCLDAGRVDQALAIARRTVATAERNHWDDSKCDAQYLLGKVLFSRGQLASALEHLRIAQAHLTDKRAVDVLSVIGDVLVDQGELAEAEACFRTVASAAEEAGNALQQARAYYCLGFTSLQAGDLEQARAHLERSTSFGTDEAGWIAAQSREMLARVARVQGDLATAEAHLLAAREAFERRGDGHGITGFLAVIHVERGQMDRARPLLEYALTTSRRLGRHSAVATLLGPLIVCLAHDHAWLELDEARLELADLVARLGMAEADSARYLLSSAETASAAGQHTRARACLELGVAQATRLGRQDLIERARALSDDG